MLSVKALMGTCKLDVPSLAPLLFATSLTLKRADKGLRSMCAHDVATHGLDRVGSQVLVRDLSSEQCTSHGCT